MMPTCSACPVSTPLITRRATPLVRTRRSIRVILVNGRHLAGVRFKIALTASPFKTELGARPTDSGRLTGPRVHLQKNDRFSYVVSLR
jgi:hypothetical protein